MISRGCRSRSTSSVAQVRRPSCTVIFCTPAFVHRASQERLKLRGSIGVPHLVVKISLPPCQAVPASSLAYASSALRSCSAVLQISGSGSVASEVAVADSRDSQLPGVRSGVSATCAPASVGWTNGPSSMKRRRYRAKIPASSEGQDSRLLAMWAASRSRSSVTTRSPLLVRTIKVARLSNGFGSR
jgi:hypothetical protein